MEIKMSYEYLNKRKEEDVILNDDFACIKIAKKFISEIPANEKVCIEMLKQIGGVKSKIIIRGIELMLQKDNYL